MSVDFYASHQEPDDLDRCYIREVQGINWSSANARLMIRFLGFPENNDGQLYGCVPLYEARRAFIKATALFVTKAKEFTRPEEIMEDGSKIRAVLFGFTEDMIKERLKQFGAFLELATLAGARSIYWC